MAPSAQVRLQGLVDVLPLALMEFRLDADRLVLVTANAAARRMPGLGRVRTRGVGADEVFDQLQGTAIVEQLGAVARLGVPLECRPVVREPGPAVAGLGAIRAARRGLQHHGDGARCLRG